MFTPAISGSKGDDVGIMSGVQRNTRLGNTFQVAHRGAFELKDIACIDGEEIVAVGPGHDVTGFDQRRRNGGRQQAGDLHQRHRRRRAVVPGLVADGDFKPCAQLIVDARFDQWIGKRADFVGAEAADAGHHRDLAGRLGQPEHGGAARRDGERRRLTGGLLNLLQAFRC